jgi:hypothetical protein
MTDRPPSKPLPDPPPRWRRRCRVGLSWVCRVGLFAVVLAFVGGRAFTDLTFWSQWLFWTPPEAWLLGVWMLALAIVVLEPSGPRRRSARLGPVVVALLVLGYTGVAHWRLQNAMLRSPGPTAVRVYHWNATEATDEALHAFLREVDPFGLRRGSPAVVVLANPPLRLDWPEIARMLADREISAAEMPRHVRRGGRFVFISGRPMSAAGWTLLDLRAQTTEPGLIDDGTAMFARVELGGGPIVVWGLDWPSDPDRGRMAFVEPTRRALEKSTHLTFTRSAAGPLRQHRDRGFPAADVVVGDFNTARGSGALARLLPGMRSAHAQAGIGPDYGWPRFLYDGERHRATIPVLGLDQAFVRSGPWRATAYRMLDLGVGTHRAQELIVTVDRQEPRDPPAARAGAN